MLVTFPGHSIYFSIVNEMKIKNTVPLRAVIILLREMGHTGLLSGCFCSEMAIFLSLDAGREINQTCFFTGTNIDFTNRLPQIKTSHVNVWPKSLVNLKVKC